MNSPGRDAQSFQCFITSYTRRPLHRGGAKGFRRRLASRHLSVCHTTTPHVPVDRRRRFPSRPNQPPTRHQRPARPLSLPAPRPIHPRPLTLLPATPLLASPTTRRTPGPPLLRCVRSPPLSSPSRSRSCDETLATNSAAGSTIPSKFRSPLALHFPPIRSALCSFGWI
jgi:hypothetical protein